MWERFTSRLVKTWQLPGCGGSEGERHRLTHPGSWRGKWMGDHVLRWESGEAGLRERYKYLIISRLLRAILISDDEIETQKGTVMCSNSHGQ